MGHRWRRPIKHIVAANEDGAGNVLRELFVVHANVESDIALTYEDVGSLHARICQERMKVSDNMISSRIQGP